MAVGGINIDFIQNNINSIIDTSSRWSDTLKVTGIYYTVDILYYYYYSILFSNTPNTNRRISYQNIADFFAFALLTTSNVIIIIIIIIIHYTIIPIF